MDSYTLSEVIEEINYNYTYFFKDDMCVNAKEELLFKNEEAAKEFYEEAINEDMYFSSHVQKAQCCLAVTAVHTPQITPPPFLLPPASLLPILTWASEGSRLAPLPCRLPIAHILPTFRAKSIRNFLQDSHFLKSCP